MKIFVTVGTTAFDELVQFVDQSPFFDAFDVTIQYGPGKYVPNNRKSFTFTKKIEDEYLSANLVISHGGAGTIYRLLELSVPVCAIPNLERIDDHQLDICEHLASLNHILNPKNIYELPKLLKEYFDGKTTLIKFKKENFFKAKEIAEYLLAN